MPTLDTGSKAAVASTGFAPAWFAFLDVAGDPVRVTNFGKDVTFASTGDVDLDGFTYKAFAGQFLDVGDVQNSDSGSDTVTVTLSGIVTLDTTLLNAIGNPANWQGRSCRLWFQVYDAAGVTAQGAIVPYYTGYMSSVAVMPGAESQTIQLTVENYLAALSQASNRDYLSQADYDAADASGAATLAAANAARHVGGSTSYAGNGVVSGTPDKRANYAIDY